MAKGLRQQTLRISPKPKAFSWCIMNAYLTRYKKHRFDLPRTESVITRLLLNVQTKSLRGPRKDNRHPITGCAAYRTVFYCASGIVTFVFALLCNTPRALAASGSTDVTIRSLPIPEAITQPTSLAQTGLPQWSLLAIAAGFGLIAFAVSYLIYGRKRRHRYEN